MLAALLSALFLLAVTHAQPSEAQDPRAAARARMVAEIVAMARETGAETGRPGFGEVRVGDGYGGWPAAAPFDAIIVTAAPAAVPQPLVDQLKPGGRMVIPVGAPSEVQHLLLLEKQPDGRTTTTRTLPVRFVPLTRDRGTKQ